MTAAEVLASILMLLGVSLALLAALGLWRFDDVFARIHAATKAITLGVLLVMAAAALRMHETPDLAKLGLAAVFQLLSAPVAGHMLGRAAYWAGVERSPHTALDELADADVER
jgi:multicomponent Na+:H+ antiporter subunit G